MNLIYLTAEELRGISGYQNQSAQFRWLRQNGFTALPRADGKPLVSRAHFEAKMGGLLSPSKSQTYEPNFGAL
jgi:hypothetical protein